MSDLFRNKYRIPSTRLQNWDYGSNAMYFVTLCTQRRICYFGEIHNKIMKLSPSGAIADELWYEIKNHATNIELGEFVVMPNHVHGIIMINGDNDQIAGDNTVETTHALSLPHALSIPPSTDPPPKTIGQQRFQHQGKNTLSSIIGSYKSAVSKQIHRLGFEFDWQSRFYDRIIRNDTAFRKISEYIVNNPVKWSEDKFFI